ncbi:MAG: type II toxin-antitoxin system VapC family toxin [Pseudonocardia sp.]|nr:type II toxin-antitoxin system VapC family toxin [Pseudonocardia sp.]
MRLLLDSHALLWWLDEDSRLGGTTASAIADPSAEVHVSAVSIAELTIKIGLGKLTVDGDLQAHVVANDFRELPLAMAHASAMQQLPLLHRDPFDRMLIAQSRVEGLTLVTADPKMSGYDVPLMAADR